MCCADLFVFKKLDDANKDKRMCIGREEGGACLRPEPHRPLRLVLPGLLAGKAAGTPGTQGLIVGVGKGLQPLSHPTWVEIVCGWGDQKVSISIDD